MVQVFLLFYPTCSCDCSERRASRLWMTFVRSRQSMQLLRNVPSWFTRTLPSASTRKYLHPNTHYNYDIQECVLHWLTPNTEATHTQIHPAFQQPCPPGSASGATASDCTPYESQTLCTWREGNSLWKSKQVWGGGWKEPNNARVKGQSQQSSYLIMPLAKLVTILSKACSRGFSEPFWLIWGGEAQIFHII